MVEGEVSLDGLELSYALVDEGVYQALKGESAASDALPKSLRIAWSESYGARETIAPNLRVVALAPTLGHQRFLRDVLPMKVLADAAMRAGAIRRFLTAASTFPESARPGPSLG